MFREANALFRVEINRTPPKDCSSIFQELLDVIADIPTADGKDLIEASVRLQWMTNSLALHDSARAWEEMTKSETAFNRWCDDFQIPDKNIVLHLQALNCEKLSLLQDPAIKLRFAEEYCVNLERADSTKTGACLSIAAESALALFQTKNDGEYLNKFFSLHQRLEVFDETVTEDLCDLIRHHLDLISVTLGTLVDRQNALEWADGFLARYPDFKAPGELSSLHSYRAALLKALMRLEEAKQAEEESERWGAAGPSLGKWMHIGLGSSAASYDSEDENEDTIFYLPWVNAMDDLVKRTRIAVHLLLDWALEDIHSARLTEEQVRTMLNIHDEQLPMNSSDGLQGVETWKRSQFENVYSIVFTKPESKISNEDKFEHISDWLSSPPQGQRNKRLYCLLVLRDSRQYHYMEGQLWDLRLTELKHLLELHRMLPAQITQLHRANPGMWHAESSLTYMAKVGDIPDLLDADVYALLLAAGASCQHAVEELRRHNQQNQLALQLRIAAQICLFKIRRLERQLVKNNENAGESFDTVAIHREIAELRMRGLKSIEETDYIRNESELQASRLETLEGLHTRQDLLSFHQNFQTSVIAIDLLLSNTGTPSQETITRIWKWAQKYKARSLARTIGIGSKVPPGLESEIVQSSTAEPLYRKMLALESDTRNASLNNRFHLRQQLEKHRQKMKEHPLLKSLIDLREGNPLDVAETALIEAHGGHPIVLIDWIFISPYPSNAKGKLLLLTARTKSKGADKPAATTMDILDTTMEDVHRWRQQYLNPDALRDDVETRPSFDRILGGLVAPLLKHTDRDEILVFCPSSHLHGLPLHALSVPAPPRHGEDDQGTQPFIARNPIVYTHSHSLLRSCFSAMEHARHSPAPMGPTFLSGISDMDAQGTSINGKPFNYTAGRTSISTLAQDFHEQPMIDDEASKSLFLKTIPQSRLLHLHTHCNWNVTDPLDHHLAFARPKVARANDLPEDLKLTAREVFDLRLLPGTHVSMIACEGGITELKLGDEVMGLVPALLYAGASSTISTLWPIDDIDGAEFSRIFFDSFVQQAIDNVSIEHPAGKGNKRNAFVDVAVALQEAAVEMEVGYKPLVHWAGFVLHGFWQYAISDADAHRLEQGLE